MDRKTFTEMALAEMAAVYRLASYLSSAQEADDLVQETYVRAFRSIDTYNPSDHGMRPWLFKILHNVLYDRLSSDQRRRVTLDALREEQAARTESPADQASSSPGREIDWEQVDGRLRTAIEGLPLHHKSIFLLSAIEGLRYREIAAVADVPIGTVMSRLCRARALLASQLLDVRRRARPHAARQRRSRPRRRRRRRVRCGTRRGEVDAVMNAPLGPHNVHEFLSAFADGELNAAQNLAVLDYLESHPEAFAYLRDRQLLRQSAQRIATKDQRDRAMPDALKARLNQLAADGDGDGAGPSPPPPGGRPAPHAHRRWWPRYLGALAIAASLSIGFTIGAARPPKRRGVAEVPATRDARPPLTADEIDARDAAVPVTLIRAAVNVHVDCSRVEERLHGGGYPVDLGPLKPLVKADLGSGLDRPDLSALGYHFVGAGPCSKPLKDTVHLLYKKDGPEPRATISLFAQRYDGQFELSRGRMYCIRGESATFPMWAWRTERVVYFLIADDMPTVVAAGRIIPSAPTHLGT